MKKIIIILVMVVCAGGIFCLKNHSAEKEISRKVPHFKALLVMIAGNNKCKNMDGHEYCNVSAWEYIPPLSLPNDELWQSEEESKQSSVEEALFSSISCWGESWTRNLCDEEYYNILERKSSRFREAPVRKSDLKVINETYYKMEFERDGCVYALLVVGTRLIDDISSREPSLGFSFWKAKDGKWVLTSELSPYDPFINVLNPVMQISHPPEGSAEESLAKIKNILIKLAK